MTARTTALRLIPALLTLAAVLVTATAAGVYREQSRQRVELLQILKESGLEDRAPRLSSLVRSDPDVRAAQERVALALVADLLDPSTRSDAATPFELEQRLEAQIDRLEVAERLARTVLATRPTSWRSSTVIGAAIYLRRSLRRDEQLLRSYQDWEEPLLRARRIAPARAEPARFLTMAYLELWPVLSEEKRELTRSLLAPSLTDRTTYLATIEPWLQVAGDDLDAIERLPQNAWLLNDVTGRLVRRGRLALALESQRRWRIALEREAEAALGRAQAASERGDHTRAAKVTVATLVGLPAQLQWLPLAERLLSAVPSGQLRGHRRFTRNWFDFELEQCLRAQCRLSREFVERSLPMSSRSSLDPLTAALSTGNWQHMAQLETGLEPAERCAGPVERYWLAKAARALREVDVRTARDALTECPSPSTDLELVHAHLLRAARRSISDPGSFGNEFTTLGESTRNGHEFALPKGDYELTVAFSRAGEASLSDLLIDGNLVASVALPPAGGTRTIRISTSGSAQFLRAGATRGPARTLRILDFRLVDPGPAAR